MIRMTRSIVFAVSPTWRIGLLVASVCLMATPGRSDDPIRVVKIGEKVPDFQVTRLNGTKVSMTELRRDPKFGTDGVIALTYWCSFCDSCRHVEKPLNELAKKYEGKAVVVAIDASVGDDAETVAAFKKEQKLTMPIVLDASGRSADLLGAAMTTTTAIIDGQGVLRYFGQFGHGRERLAEQALEAVLAGRDVKVTHTRQRG